MTEPDLLTVSVTAFAAVLVLLGLLAGMIRGLTALFPGEPDAPAASDASGAPDSALLAAVAAAAARVHPGTRITKVEEIR